MVISTSHAMQGALFYGFLKKYSLNNHQRMAQDIWIQSHILLLAELEEELVSLPPTFPRKRNQLHILILTQHESRSLFGTLKETYEYRHKSECTSSNAAILNRARVLFSKFIVIPPLMDNTMQVNFEYDQHEKTPT